MTTLPSDTGRFLEDVERFAGRKLSFRTEVEQLVQASAHHGLEQTFEEIVFYAKFITNAAAVLKRSGTSGEETAKLMAEWNESLQKLTSLLTSILVHVPEEIRRRFTSRFLSLDQQSMGEYLSLLHDLSWIKNYWLDQKRIEH